MNGNDEKRFVCKCGYETCKRTHILNHINKKKKCCKEMENISVVDLNEMLNVCNICSKVYRNKTKHLEDHKKEQKNKEEQINEKNYISLEVFEKKLKDMEIKLRKEIEETLSVEIEKKIRKEFEEKYGILNNNTNSNNDNIESNNTNIITNSHNKTININFINYDQCKSNHIDPLFLLEYIQDEEDPDYKYIIFDRMYYDDNFKEQNSIYYSNKSIRVFTNGKFKKITKPELYHFVKNIFIYHVWLTFDQLIHDKNSHLFISEGVYKRVKDHYESFKYSYKKCGENCGKNCGEFCKTTCGINDVNKYIYEYIEGAPYDMSMYKHLE